MKPMNFFKAMCIYDPKIRAVNMLLVISFPACYVTGRTPARFRRADQMLDQQHCYTEMSSRCVIKVLTERKILNTLTVE